MNIIKCDRCGKEIKDPDDAFIIETGQKGYRMICRPDRYDLCSDCNDTLLAWLRPEANS